MTILRAEKYRQHREARTQKLFSNFHEIFLLMLLFGSMGAITWAIRGSAGWGGVDGTVVPGLMWGLLWYYVCFRKGIDARGIILWLGLGIALGGELGYGQYVSWIQGRFYAGEEIIAISPWKGYIWFVLCGVGWAAPGGILLGWALGGRASASRWIVRAFLLISLLVVLFAWQFVDWLGMQFVRFVPQLLFPNADLGIYAGTLGKHLSRTIYTNTQNFVVVVWWIIALLAAAFQRDRATLVTGLVLGAGFGLGFMQSALWCLGYGFAPGFIDWWKMWELNAGFNLGLLYVIVLIWAIRKTDSEHHSDGIHYAATDVGIARTLAKERYNSLFLAIGGALLIYFMGFEYFFWTGVFLSVFYFIAVCLPPMRIGGATDPDRIAVERKDILLTFSAFLLVFLMFHGASERAGIFLGLYQADAVDQYAWPPARIALFAPVALILVGTTVFRIWRILHTPKRENLTATRLPERMIDLMTAMGFIGALSIWPAKIGVLYALFLIFALFAFTRINRRLDRIDAAGT